MSDRDQDILAPLSENTDYEAFAHLMQSVVRSKNAEIDLLRAEVAQLRDQAGCGHWRWAATEPARGEARTRCTRCGYADADIEADTTATPPNPRGRR